LVTPRIQFPRSSRKSKRSSDPYGGVDLQTASRFGAYGWAIALCIALSFLPFFPPTERIGAAGWIVAGAGFVLIGVWIIPLVARVPSGTTLFVTGFAAIALIGGLEWLVGSAGPYTNLYLMVVISSALVQPPGRLALVVAAVAVASFLPAAYDRDAFQPGDTAMDVLLWTGVAAFVYMLMVQLREQRAELERYGEEAERTARSDPLTGARNRRAFDHDIAMELERSKRTGFPLSLAVLDLDGFKQVNDELGHQVGDEVLRAVAAAMSAETRTVDGCYRWGGDEFALVLPGSSRGAAKMICRRVAERLERESPLQDGAPIRMSAGVVQFGRDMTVDEAVAAADADLFAVKRLRHSSGVA
jgi:diguanylate cyclase (GGDEF)-like protein